MFKFRILVYILVPLFSLITLTAHSANEIDITISRLKVLPLGFVVKCLNGDLRLTGKLGQASFRIKRSALCFGKDNNHIVCIVGASGENKNGEPIPDCRQIRGTTI
jgi:hypothetical protein